MLTTRAAGPDDQAFLFALYATTRQDELSAWGWDPAAQQAFLQMQYRAQSLGYQSQYPRADNQIILSDGQAVGRLIVDRQADAIILVDIALLPAFRGRGIGEQLIRTLQGEAADTGKSLRLQVLKVNPARRLYERLGFSATGENGPYEQMHWPATP